MTLPLDGIRVVNIGVNLPADAAASRLAELGATVTKVEPPDGDPMASAAPVLYAELAAGQTVVRLDLKTEVARARLDEVLAEVDLLLSSSRPSALERLGLGRTALAERHPALLQVAIVGHAAPDQELAGHDLTYSARHGLLSPPALPRTLVADLAGAERAVTAALALLLARARQTGSERYTEVALADGAAFFALPLRHGVTSNDGFLGGGDPYYGIYAARDGWVALAALEPKFRRRVVEAFGAEPGSVAFAKELEARAAGEWERWAGERDIPLAEVVEPPTA